ncbi:MAG: hypothetical protein AAGI63_16900 [Planctomycetota bacterium]
MNRVFDIASLRCIALTNAPTQRRRSSHPRLGATLLDVALGSMLLSTLLIPAVHLIGESYAARARLKTRDTILFEAEAAMERAKMSLSRTGYFRRAHRSGIQQRANIRLTDGPRLRRRTRMTADPTMTDEQLVNVVVEVWQDDNRNWRIDLGEPNETLRTQWAAP